MLPWPCVGRRPAPGWVLGTVQPSSGWCPHPERKLGTASVVEEHRSWSSVLRERTLREFVLERRNWSDIVTGTVKRVVPERGFGFITGEDGQDYFFHRTALTSSTSIETLTPNQRVLFEIEISDRGPRASQVRLT